MKKIVFLGMGGLLALAGLIVMGRIVFQWLADGGTDRMVAVIAATCLFPVGFFAFRLGMDYGRSEAKGAMTGLQMGTQHVLGAASQAIDLRARSITATRQAQQESYQPISLPGSDFSMRPALPPGKEIDL